MSVATVAGPDLRKLAARGHITRNINFVQYATGMLAALQHVHKHGIVHKDVKPANFCLGASNTCYSDKVFLRHLRFQAASTVDMSCSVTQAVRELLTKPVHMQVYIVDFGLAGVTPNRERAAQDKDYQWTNFQGTPDYASADALHSLRCSAKVLHTCHCHAVMSKHPLMTLTLQCLVCRTTWKA